MSLARAFMLAGSPSLITTLWKVEDMNSAKLMDFFYQEIKNGNGKDEALSWRN